MDDKLKTRQTDATFEMKALLCKNKELLDMDTVRLVDSLRHDADSLRKKAEKATRDQIELCERMNQVATIDSSEDLDEEEIELMNKSFPVRTQP